MRYYFGHFSIPTTNAPYNDESKVWPSAVGNLVKPVVDRFEGLKFWFSFSRSYIQFAAYTDQFDQLAEALKKRADDLGFGLIRPPETGDTLEGDCAREKFVTAPSKDRTKRAKLVLDYLHTISALYIDTLVDKGSHWQVEENTDANNPDKVSFQAFHHMLCNISQVPLAIYHYQYGTHKVWDSPFAISHIAEQLGDKAPRCGNRHDVHF